MNNSMKTEVRFSWAEFNGRYFPACQCVGAVDRYDYLGCLLIDDGGLGLDHHIPWLQHGKKLCENVLEGRSANECFTTECFSADISADGVWVASITAEHSSGARFLAAGFLYVLDAWIAFLQEGIKRDGVAVAIHADL
jgi:hypothetical protein